MEGESEVLEEGVTDVPTRYHSLLDPCKVLKVRDYLSDIDQGRKYPLECGMPTDRVIGFVEGGIDIAKHKRLKSGAAGRTGHILIRWQKTWIP